jgi:hypothetical protein
LSRRVIGVDDAAVSSRPPAVGVVAAISWAAGLFASGCAHREPQRDPPPARKPIGDIADALEPCPPDFPGMSVRAVRSREWPGKTCFAIVGHLTATYADGVPCTLRPLSTDATKPAGSPPPEVPRCTSGWAFTDVSDPIVVRANDDAGNPPFIWVSSAWSAPFIRPVLQCNRDSAGQPILPADARFQLPVSFELSDIPRVNAGLANVTVGLVGGSQARDEMPDTLDDFDKLVFTHACRVNAPDAGVSRVRGAATRVPEQ